MGPLKPYCWQLSTLLVVVLIMSGCVSQQKKTSQPTVPQPQTSQSEQRDPPEAAETTKARSDDGQAESSPTERTDQTAQDQLQAAREKLRVSQETEKRVKAEFENLKQSGRATNQVTKDYETYLSRVQGLVAENQEMVDQLEKAIAVQSAGKVDTEKGKESPAEASQLDRQLNQSLSEFDDMLLEEMEKIQAQSERKMTSLAEEAAAAADRLRKQGIDVGSGEGEKDASTQQKDPDERREGEATESAAKGTAGQSGQQGEGDRDGRAAEAEEGTSGSQQAKTDTGGDAGGTRSDDRSKTYNEEDDDIVARQLREAAENETDPELKEKLWKEYEEYKRNTRP
jgi:hypothetical protein